MNNNDLNRPRQNAISGANISDAARNPDLFAKQVFKKPISSEPSINVVQRTSLKSDNMIINRDSQIIAPNNPNRSYMIIQNQGILDVFVNFGQRANDSKGMVIGAGGFYEPLSIPIDSIYMWCDGEVKVCFIEGEPA